MAPFLVIWWLITVISVRSGCGRIVETETMGWFGGKTIGHVMGQSKQIVSNINQTGQEEEEEGRRRNKHRKHNRGENQKKPIVDKKKTKKDCRRKSGLNVLQDQFCCFFGKKATLKI